MAEIILRKCHRKLPRNVLSGMKSESREKFFVHIVRVSFEYEKQMDMFIVFHELVTIINIYNYYLHNCGIFENELSVDNTPLQLLTLTLLS